MSQQLTSSISTATIPSPTTSLVLGTGITPRPYQIEALEKVGESFHRGNNRLLVCLPTGTGKTVIFGILICLRKQLHTLVLAHRDELIEQAADKIKMIMPDAQIGIVKAGRNEIDAPIVIASVQSLSQKKRLQGLLNKFNTVIIDEAHHAASTSYLNILNSLGCFDNPKILTVGVTATPNRADKVGLGCAFQQVVYYKNLLEMISAQYLCDLTNRQVDLNIDLNKVKCTKGDFQERALGEALEKAGIEDAILKQYQTESSNRKIIVFLPTVALVHKVADHLKVNGVAAEGIDGSMPIDARRAILKRLKQGTTKVIVNCMILTEGFDEPSVDSIFLARPTKSQSLYLQMIGRGTRPHPDKQNCEIVDFVSTSQQHKLITLPNLFGLEPKRLVNRPRTLLEAVQEREEELQSLAAQKQKPSQRTSATTYPKPAQPMPQASPVASPPSPIPVTPAQYFQQVKQFAFHWLKFDDHLYMMALENFVYLIEKPDGTWDVIALSSNSHYHVLGSNLSLNYAQGVAEDFARSLPNPWFANTYSNWRKLPATDKQREILRGEGIREYSTLTKGVAADLIGLHIGLHKLFRFNLSSYTIGQILAS